MSTKFEAQLRALELSRKGAIVAVVKAMPGEIHKGFYAEHLTSALPPNQVLSLWQFSKNIPLADD